MTTRVIQYLRPCAMSITGNKYFLPLPIMEWDEDISYRDITQEIPKQDGKILIAKKQNETIIRIRGVLCGTLAENLDTTKGLYNPSAGVWGKRAIYKIPDQYGYGLKDRLTAGLKNTYYLYRWFDRRYERVSFQNVRLIDTNMKSGILEYEAEFIAYDPQEKYINVPKIETAGDYESWVWQGDPYLGGKFNDWGDEDPIIEGGQTDMSYGFIVDGLFSGVAETNDQITFVLPGNAGVTYQITGVGISGITGVVPGQTATTIVKAINGENESEVTLAYNEVANYTAAPNFYATGGSYLTFKIQSGGTHNDLGAYCTIRSYDSTF